MLNTGCASCVAVMPTLSFVRSGTAPHCSPGFSHVFVLSPSKQSLVLWLLLLWVLGCFLEGGVGFVLFEKKNFFFFLDGKSLM